MDGDKKICQLDVVVTKYLSSRESLQVVSDPCVCKSDDGKKRSSFTTLPCPGSPKIRQAMISADKCLSSENYILHFTPMRLGAAYQVLLETLLNMSIANTSVGPNNNF